MTALALPTRLTGWPAATRWRSTSASRH